MFFFRGDNLNIAYAQTKLLPYKAILKKLILVHTAFTSELRAILTPTENI